MSEAARNIDASLPLDIRARDIPRKIALRKQEAPARIFRIFVP